MSRLATGLAATVVTGAVSLAVWGRAGAFAAMAFALLATGLQLLAARLVRRAGGEATIDRPALYGIGVLLRITGVVLFGVAVTRDRERFPPLPAAFGYLGAVLPLLYMETRPRR